MNCWNTKSGTKIIQLLSGRSNVFLLTNGIRNGIIDTGIARNWARLDNSIKSLNINRIDYLILTHTHFDHAANAKRLRQDYGASVIVHKDEADFLSAGKNEMASGTNFILRLMTTLVARRILNALSYEPCEYDVTVDSGYDLTALGFNAYIMHTPGHTKGSVSVIVDDEIAVVGDAMFGVFKWSVFPPYANDAAQMITSWGKLLGTNCYLFLPSHGTSNSRALLQKEYDKRKKVTKASKYRVNSFSRA